MKMSAGLTNAVKKVRGSGRICDNCGYEYPRYPGKYPENCPSCGVASINSCSTGKTLESVSDLGAPPSPALSVVKTHMIGSCPSCGNSIPVGMMNPANVICPFCSELFKVDIGD